MPVGARLLELLDVALEDRDQEVGFCVSETADAQYVVQRLVMVDQ